MLSDDRPTPEDNTILDHDSLVRRNWLEEALDNLGEREAKIIRMRRLTDEGVTLEELGKHFGVSKERVRQLEHRAMNKLKTFMMDRIGQADDLYLES